MIPELGHYALLLALPVALIQALLPLLGAWRGNRAWMALARPAARASFLLVGLSFGCLVWSFVTDDFSVRYVAENSNSLLPMIYKVGATWGGHEGSFLLWLFMLAGWTLAVSMFSRSLPEDMVARVIGVLGAISVGFLVFIILASDPFVRLLPAAPNGRDLNPLLQDPGLVGHPPMLYMGYVGFAVAFAFAVAALLAGRLDAAWARWSRPWTLAAWVALTAGIALGSHWSYYELGWGGWWFWDPVENASFMPWLLGTALIHSLAVTEKRGSFRNWTVLLAIGAFSLSLLGTFLVRSGVLSSVHSFATDPRRGLMILLLLALVVGGSLLLFALRAPRIAPGAPCALISRETLLLGNNVLLLVATASVLLGTLYPLLMDALGLGKLSVGPPYFNNVFVPVVVPLFLLAAVGPIARWRNADPRDLAHKMRGPALAALVAAVALPLWLGRWNAGAALGSFCAMWVAAAAVKQTRERLRSGNPPAGYWGMQLAHMGLAVSIVGVALVSHYQVQRDLRMAPGDSTLIAGYKVRFDGVREVPGPNYKAQQGRLELSRDGRELALLHPQKRDYFSSSMPMTEAAIDSGPLRDIYVSLGEPLGGGAWAVRVYYKPFVIWIWGGALLMVAGGIAAAADRRYRLLSRRAAAALSAQVSTT
ncbi:MAG: heme lyase CcmF/NrfE family subunit [Betaproteobacteria bacterium]|nr:heme lyase CcmF/NrfE family subunit [Betaproteobacteria bacterium]MBU6510829.1 heme lyase CcmF/NrfE family subunit [Betaproteobacteria bacterium]MDE1954288.1 heme lyase CcmF/NrfE family subunit [Betaproteobacteria bacterium]MDE2150952.1 heme lyase CcmF/NrfE family subunit [Betaproteobacteria bacterium]MDE2478482.1 heme lyase CcmF/NrfE family subunit [Betaproteobacteria bacterium]